MRRFRQYIFPWLVFLFPLHAHAQALSSAGTTVAEQPAAVEPHTYGTTAITYLTLSPWAFRPLNSTVTYQTQNFPFSIYRTGGSPYFEAPVNLPSGAQVVEMELHACDTNPETFAWIRTYLVTQPHVASAGRTQVNGPDTVAGSGCGFFVAAVNPPVTIENLNGSYTVELDSGISTDFTVRFAGFRIGYKLQVSPAPATPTFSDVPTSHLFYQYIEALAAAGITGGCTAPPNPNYCPEATLTRGQMAVFLARALGLHFAP